MTHETFTLSLRLAPLVAALLLIGSVRGQDEPLTVPMVFLRGVGAEPKVGSGFLVRANEEDRAFLVSAAHVSMDLGNAGWEMYMAGADGAPLIIPINNAKWAVSDVADVAILEFLFDGLTEENRRGFLARCIPENLLDASEVAPNRNVTLTAVGFPRALGAINLADKALAPSDKFAPLIIETRAASGFITLPRFDTKQPATFLVLQDPSIGGMSGGPVWDTRKAYAVSQGMVFGSGGGVWSIVGLMHGTLGDQTGGKLGVVVPAKEIRRLLSKVMETRR